MSDVDPRCGSDEHLLACVLSTWAGEPRRCRWCDAELTGRRVRWCSDACAGAMGRNHWWTYASHAARERDGDRCVVCGSQGVDYGIGARGLEVHHVTPLHTLTMTVERWVYATQNEVIETRRVKHADGGCWHHVDGLVTLCKPHHLEAHRAIVVATPVDQLAFDS